MSAMWKNCDRGRGQCARGFGGTDPDGGIGEADKSEKFKSRPEEYPLCVYPGIQARPAQGDNYIIYLDGDALPVDACLVKGYNYAAYREI